MQIRFMRQIYSIIDEGIKPVNYINPKKTHHHRTENVEGGI
jgi:uncharacterized membrane protein